MSSFLALYIDLVHTPDRAFADSGDLVSIGQNDGRTLDAMSLALIGRINQEVSSLSATAGYLNTGLDLGPEREERRVEFVSDGLFSELRARLQLGRGFDERDHAEAAVPVAVISYRYWQEDFGGSPDVIDRILEITGRPALNLARSGRSSTVPPEDRTTAFRIIGVMGRDLVSLQEDVPVAAWIPVEQGMPRYFAPLDALRNFNMLRALSRRAPGATPEAIAAELNQRYEDADNLGVNPDEPFDAMSGLVFDINTQRNAIRQLKLFLAGGSLLVLVAAANVSLYLLSRAPGRRRELGIRMSVGAPLGRLGRQLATEAGLLVLLAGAFGLLAAFWLQSYLKSQPFLEGARWQSVSLFDWRVTGVIFVVLLLLTLLISLVPVWSLKKAGIASSSRQIATRANLTQQVACTVQIAIAGMVTAAAITFGWYLGVLLAADHGYDARNVHVVTLAQGPVSSSQDFGRRLIERERARAAISAIPGLDAVAFGSAAPGIDIATLPVRIRRPVPPGDPVQFGVVSADRQYFEMLDIKLAKGRVYDGDESDVMLVNEAAARLVWGRPDVTGEMLPVPISGGDTAEVIGVVSDVSYGHPEAEAAPRVYVPILPRGELILIRSPLATAEVRTRLQSLVDSGDLEIAIQNVQRLSDRIGEFIAADRARSILTIVSAVVVVVLAGFGLYGTQRYLVSAGRREYAVRASIGAGPTALGRLVLRRGLALGLPGVVLGGLFAFIVAAWLRDDFVSRDISPTVVTAAVVAGLVALLLIASAGPARHARRVQPAPLLREE